MRRDPGRPLGAVGTAMALALALTACAGTSPEPLAPVGSTDYCADDTPSCINRRQTALRTMMSAKDRRWVREPATAQSYAAGVRLFAFKGRKRELTCEELAHGRREADAAPSVLRGPAGRQLTPAQVSRGAMLAAEVSRELSIEMRRRCRG